MNIIQVFAVYETVDDRGRRGNLLGVFEKEIDAKVFSDGKGWYGSAGDIAKYSAIKNPANNNVFLLERVSGDTGIPLNDPQGIRAERIRKTALNKLTPEERKVLGV